MWNSRIRLRVGVRGRGKDCSWILIRSAANIHAHPISARVGTTRLTSFCTLFWLFWALKKGAFFGVDTKKVGPPRWRSKSAPASAVRSLASEHEKRRAFAVRSAAPPRPDSVAPPPPAAWTSPFFGVHPKKVAPPLPAAIKSLRPPMAEPKKTASAAGAPPKNLRRKNFHQHRLPNGRNMYVRSFFYSSSGKITRIRPSTSLPIRQSKFRQSIRHLHFWQRPPGVRFVTYFNIRFAICHD